LLVYFIYFETKIYILIYNLYIFFIQILLIWDKKKFLTRILIHLLFSNRNTVFCVTFCLNYGGSFYLTVEFCDYFSCLGVVVVVFSWVPYKNYLWWCVKMRTKSRIWCIQRFPIPLSHISFVILFQQCGKIYLTKKC